MSPRIAAKEFKEPHAFSFIPVVHQWTLCLDSPDAPALDVDPALLPDKRLHQLPRAEPGARHRHVPGLRLLEVPELAALPGTAQAGVARLRSSLTHVSVRSLGASPVALA